MKIDRMYGVHSGRCGIILGGGPSLPKQLKNKPENAIVFGVNSHASRLIKCDYIVFNDENTFMVVKRLEGRKISRWRHDITQDAPKGLISGICALRAAQIMGCYPIILMGFDCYENKGYFWNLGAELLGNTISVQRHVNFWENEDKRGVYVAGGPLKEVFEMAKKVKSRPETMHIEITEDQSVNLDERRSVNFIRGIYPKMSAELAEAAINADCGKLIEKE